MLDFRTMDRKDCEIYGGLGGLIAGLILAALLRGVVPGLFLVIVALGAAAGGVAYARKACGKAGEAEEKPAPEAIPEPAPETVAAPKAAAAPAAAKTGAKPAKTRAKAASGPAKPAFLAAARDGGADDLKLIKGVGKKLEKTLNDLGVYHYDQIAAWTTAEIAWIDDHLNFRGRIDRDGWIDQARILAAGGETDFSKRAAGGGVPSSQG